MDKIEAIATQFGDAVRAAFVKVFGKPSNEESYKAVSPSWSDHGVAVGWHDPDPGVVLIFSEYGWIPDPYSEYKGDRDGWKEAMEVLRKSGWDDVSFESINAAVHIVYWKPRSQWQKILNDRINRRMNP